MPSPFPGMDPYLEDRRIWRDVHTQLIVAISNHLTPLIEPDYSVAIEERISIARAEPAEKVIQPDVSVIEVRDTESDELVTTLEVLSPSNKVTGSRRRDYEAKRRQVFELWTSLVVIDLLRVGRLMAMRPAPSGDYRILVLASWEYPRAQLFAFNLPQPIPEVTVPLREGEAPVPLPLGRLLNEVYDRARYSRRVRYGEPPPEPPLMPETAAWLDARLREQGLRGG